MATLSNTSRDINLEVPISDDVIEALDLQREHAIRIRHADKLMKNVAEKVEQAIQSCLDWELQSPTKAQLAYAASIARQLNVEIPEEVLRFRGEMHRFLDYYSAELKKPQGSSD